MPDYHPLIARAVSRLEKNTPEGRQGLFEQTRAILSDQLRNRQTPASDYEIMRERAALDEAIRKIESEIATESTPHAGSIGAPSKSDDGKSQVRAFEQEGVVSSPPRGRITLSPGQRPVIELGQTADASTVFNSLAHAWLDELMRDAAHPLAPNSLRQDARTVLKWLGVAKPEAIETKHHDQFARAFERYVMEGQSPSGALAPALATLSESLPKVYGTPDSLKVPLNDDLRGVFNRQLAIPDQIAAWTADRERAAIAPEYSADTTDRNPPYGGDAEAQFAFAEQYYEAYQAANGFTIQGESETNPAREGRLEILALHQAIKWWEIAAERGYAPAQNRLGWAYSYGEGVPEDFVKAYLWLTLAWETNKTQHIIHYPSTSDEQKNYLEGLMTSAQITEARKLVQDRLRNHETRETELARAQSDDIRKVFNPAHRERAAIIPERPADPRAAHAQNSDPESQPQWTEQRKPPVATAGIANKLTGFFQRWRDARAQAAAKRANFQRRFESFLLETEPFVRESKHQKAALYRLAWKRAAILAIIYQRKSDSVLAAQFQGLEKLAAERYFEVAPQTLYGKAPLKMGEKAAARLLEFETQRLFPTDAEERIRPLACIYIGTCEQGRIYVGQTIGAPESRWVQHRFGGTGPFKRGEQYVQWNVIEGSIDPAKLDERESYYIGLYDADKTGYNDTQGNDWRAYRRGQSERMRRTVPR
jgi:TPR repeat protein